MLPIFQVITPKIPPRSMIMSSHEVPEKPRRRKPEVPIHVGAHGSTTETKNKTSKPIHIEPTIPTHTKSRQHIIDEIQESSKDKTVRISKRYLTRENLRLNKENRDLFTKFNELEELSVKKINKLKEKIQQLQNSNSEVVKENETYKEVYQNLLSDHENLKQQFELSQYCTSCVDLQQNLQKYSVDIKNLRTDNNDLVEDLNMLKTVIFRLNVQLERYQEKLRKNNIKVNKTSPTLYRKVIENEIITAHSTGNVTLENHRDHTHTPISWGAVNVHTLGPLLDAYQDTLDEKQNIIQNYETEISIFTGKLKEIIDENELLHTKLMEDDNCSAKLKVKLAETSKELKVAKEQNDILIKKCSLKQDKIEEILKIYENKVEQMKRDYAVAHEQYFKVRTELATLKEKNKSLADAQEDFRNERQNYIPISVHNASVNECKTWYEELKLQYEKEKQKLKVNYDEQCKTIEELNNKIISVNGEKQGLETKIIQLEKQIKKVECRYLELEHNLNEVQLSRSACRKQLHKVMIFAKDMVSEQELLLKALNQRHLENKAVKKIGSDMATKMDSLKSQLKDVQKTAWQEFSTVEQKIQEQQEIIEYMKQKHDQEIERLQKIIKDQKEKNMLFKNDNLPLPTYLLFNEKYNT